ncbi:cephalosporin-C deacetylase [Enterococcus sp. AZ194]|uniref:acetylxylan esterase n=1 Tax=Enterococcus sp. AZ194 TaxID=2774629 RepID=UPI003F290747
MNTTKQFWKKTLDELARTPSQFQRKKRPDVFPHAEVYDFSFQSLLEETIYGLLLIPKIAHPCPIIIDFLGYMNQIQSPDHYIGWLETGCAYLLIDNRGQGGKTMDTAPYETITLNAPIGKGFLASEDFYMRRIIADNLRAVTLVSQLPEIDSKKIFLRGGSQGGGLALIVNALTEQSIQATFANVPSHSTISKRIDEGTGSYGIIHDYIKQHPETDSQIKGALSVFDTVNLVESIQNPVYISVGSADPICPMTNFIPTYHKLHSPKEIIIYWNKGHEGGGQRQLKREMRKINELLKEQ